VLEEQVTEAAHARIQARHGERGQHTFVEVEEPAGSVACLDQAIGIKQQPVALLQHDVLPDGAGMQAERRRGLLRHHDLRLRIPGARPHFDRRMMAAVHDVHLASAEFGKDSGDEILDPHLAGQAGIHLLSEPDQIGFGECQRTESADHRRAALDRVQALSPDVANDETRPELCHRQIVKITADQRPRRRRLVVRGETDAAEFGRQRPQDRALHPFGDPDEPAFPPAADFRDEYREGSGHQDDHDPLTLHRRTALPGHLPDHDAEPDRVRPHHRGCPSVAPRAGQQRADQQEPRQVKTGANDDSGNRDNGVKDDHHGEPYLRSRRYHHPNPAQ